MALHRMYSWRDVAHYVVDVIQPALDETIGSLARTVERQTADRKRLDQLVEAHNELVREVRRMKEST